MITYKDSLQHQINKIQKLINEINESGMEGFTIRSGVIVDMTCNIIITSSLITDELTTKSITSESITSKSITSESITNSSTLKTNNLTVDNSVSASSLIVSNLTVNNSCQINTFLRCSNDIDGYRLWQDGSRFIYDTNATIYFGKHLNNVIAGNCINKCVCWGFLNKSSYIATINTGYVQLNFDNSDSRWLSLLKITVNGYNLTCINYPNLSGTDNTVITTSGTDYVNGNIPTMPPITGQCDLVYFNRKRYKNHPDTDEYTTYYLFPYGQKVTYNSTAYNAYTVRYGNCNDLNTNLSSIVVRLSNVIMKW